MLKAIRFPQEKFQDKMETQKIKTKKRKKVDLPMGSRSTLFRLESSLVSDMVAAIGPLLLLLLLLFKLSGPRDVISGDDAAESF